MVNPKQTSPRVASEAARQLGNKKTPKKVRIVDASALAQARKKSKKK